MAGRAKGPRTVRRNASAVAARRRTTRLLVLGLVLVVVVVAVAAGLVTALHDGNPPTSTSDVPPAAGPGLDLTAPPSAPSVLATVTPAPISVARLKRHVAAALASPALGGHLGFAVAQLGNPAAGWAEGARTVMPASTLKLLTTTAALATMGGDHRFTTSVVRGTRPGTIVLVGGGDPLLVDTAAQAGAVYPRPASLQALAAATAARLRSQGVRRVSLGYDTSLFTGPAVNPHWPSTYITDDVVSPITALWVNEGRTAPTSDARSAKPAVVAAQLFRTELVKAGIQVNGAVTAQPHATAATTTRLAAVSSPPLQEIVQHILELSDNEGAEVLLRQVAVAAGKPGTSAAGVTAVRAALERLGLDLHGAVLYDGSGLSRDDEVPVALLLHVLETDASPSHPALRGVVTGLPVAGFSGSLSTRFVADARAGLGHVQAKTGTLTGVSALAGVTTTKTGQALVFVAIANDVEASETVEARVGLDQIAAALSTCGC